MKKMLFAALAAVSMVACATPALAQNGNQAIRYQEAIDPGYQSAVRSGGAYGNYYGGGYGIVPSCFMFSCLFSGHHSHRPENGELRNLPDGTTVSYDRRTNTWPVVHQPTTQPRGVYVDRDVYVADK